MVFVGFLWQFVFFLGGGSAKTSEKPAHGSDLLLGAENQLMVFARCNF